MDKILFLWDYLNLILSKVDKVIENKIIQIIADYFVTFFLIGIFFFVVRLIIYLAYKFLSYIGGKFKFSKNIILIRWEVELKVFFERLYFAFKIYKIRNVNYDENKFRKSGKYSPSGIFKIIESIFKTIISFNIYNLFIWMIVINYKFQFSINDINKIVNKEILESTLGYLKSIGFNKFTETLKNISFIVVSILIVTGYWSYLSTYRKTSNDKLGKVLMNQDKLINILSEMVYKLEENIDTLLRMKDYLPDILIKLIIYTDTYSFIDKKLIKFNDYGVKYDYEDCKFIEQQLNEFESYKENIEMLAEMMQQIEQDNLRDIYKKIYKNMWYEENRLNIFLKEPFKDRKLDLLDREELVKWMINMKDRNISERFEKIIEVKRGIISKEEYEKEEDNNFRISFDDIEKLYEEKLEKKLIVFSENIDNKLRDSIEIYLILKKFLDKLYKLNRKLEIFSKLK